MILRQASLVLFLAALCARAETVTPALPLCSDAKGSPACHAPKKDLKAAREAFKRGIKIENAGNPDEALIDLEEAARLVPNNVDYLTSREMVRQRAVALHMSRGSKNLDSGRQAEALAEFRIALNLDPQNEYAQQRMHDALAPAQVHTSAAPQLVASSDSIAPEPTTERHDFHYRGDSRGLINSVVSSYGLTAIIDDSFPSRRLRFDVEDVDFPKAMQAALAVAKGFAAPLDAKTLLITLDSPENRRQYERMGLRSYYVPGASTPQELNDVMNALRSLFELRFVSLNANSRVITIRGPQGTVQAASQFVESLNAEQPEVLLDMKIYSVDHSYARNIGLHIPNDFNLFNIPGAALAALAGLGSGNIQDLINQLVSSGGINQAGNESIGALLAQLQNQQGGIFSQPLATFGGGLTFMGLSIDQLRATLSLNESSVKTLEHVTLRASQGKDATFKIGSRYPILNASFSPIFNSQAIAQVIGNQSFTAPVPSVSYEDLGLTLKAKPSVSGNLDVSLQLELQLRTLGGASLNGVPVISNREYKGGIALREGEPAVIAGMMSQSEQRSLSGLPSLSRVPGLRALAAESSKQESENEILIVITPHVVRSPDAEESPEIWLGK